VEYPKLLGVTDPEMISEIREGEVAAANFGGEKRALAEYG
jgi:hypothetical protein